MLGVCRAPDASAGELGGVEEALHSYEYIAMKHTVYLYIYNNNINYQIVLIIIIIIYVFYQMYIYT